MGPGLGVGSIWVIAYEEFDIPYEQIVRGNLIEETA